VCPFTSDDIKMKIRVGLDGLFFWNKFAEICIFNIHGGILAYSDKIGNAGSTSPGANDILWTSDGRYLVVKLVDSPNGPDSLTFY
jgi:hypothetical protein